MSAFCEGTSRITDIVYQNNIPVGNISNHNHTAYLIGTLSMLITNHHIHFKKGGYLADTVCTSNIRCSKCQVFQVKIFYVRNEDGRRIKVIYRDIKIALDLRCMEVHCNNPVGTGSSKHVGNKLCTYGNSWPVFTVLSCISVVGDN